MIPSQVQPLYTCWWEKGQVTKPYPSLAAIRDNVQDSLKTLRQDHKRSLNPTPYKVTQMCKICFVSPAFSSFFHEQCCAAMLFFLTLFKFSCTQSFYLYSSCIPNTICVQRLGCQLTCTKSPSPLCLPNPAQTLPSVHLLLLPQVYSIISFIITLAQKQVSFLHI